MLKLLIINDDASFTHVLHKAMEERDYDVRSCYTVEQAAEIATAFKPEFVILELNINGENGIVLIPQLKAINENCIIAVLTSYGTIKSAVWSIRNGAADYVTKPVDADELDHLLKRCANIKTTIPDILPSPEEAKEAHIVEFFEKNDRRVATTARMLGLHRRTLQRILARIGLDRNGAEFAKRATSIGRAKRLMRLWSNIMIKRKRYAKFKKSPVRGRKWVAQIDQSMPPQRH